MAARRNPFITPFSEPKCADIALQSLVKTQYIYSELGARKYV